MYTAKDDSTGRTIIHGFEKYITEALAKAINFNLTMMNISGTEVRAAIENGYIHFSACSYVMVRPEPRVTPSIFMYSFPNALVVWQHPRYKTEMEKGTIFTVGVFLVIIVILTFAAWLLKLSSKKWRIYNITQVLMGNSIPIEMKENIERIFFLVIICVSITFSANVVDILLQINFHHTEFIDLNTIDDALRENIKFCSPAWVVDQIQQHVNHPRVNELINNTI